MLFRDARQALLRDCGIRLVLDVGANSGQYATRLRQDGYEGKIISFEPVSVPYATLEAAAATDPLWETRKLALGGQSGRAVLNISANSYSSSFFPIADITVDAAAEAAFVGTQEVECATLDSLEVSSDEPSLLKMDVQGYEPEVIRGGRRLLSGKTVRAVEAELSLVPLYQGQDLAPEVCKLLRIHGFFPVALDNAFWHPETGEILQIDGLFRRLV